VARLANMAKPMLRESLSCPDSAGNKPLALILPETLQAVLRALFKSRSEAWQRGQEQVIFSARELQATRQALGRGLFSTSRNPKRCLTRTLTPARGRCRSTTSTGEYRPVMTVIDGLEP